MSDTTARRKAACPSCNSGFVINPEMNGRRAKCPKCGQPFVVAIESPLASNRPVSPTPAPLPTRTRPLKAPVADPPDTAAEIPSLQVGRPIQVAAQAREIPGEAARRVQATAFPSAIFHPIDLFIEFFRQQVAPDYPATAARHAAIVGVFVTYASIVCILIRAATLATGRDARLPIQIGLALAITLFVLQFVACRLLASLETMISANPSRLGSLALPDTVCVTVLLFTVVGAVGGAISAFTDRSTPQAEAAFIWLIVGLHAACVAVRPRELGFVIDPRVHVAEEAVGVVRFFVRLALRLVPLLFATGVIFGTMHMALGFLWTRRGDEPLRVAIATLDGAFGSMLLFAAAALPLLAYLLALLMSVSLDVVSAIVSIPAKLDGLHAASSPDDGHVSKPDAVADTTGRA